MTSATIFFIEKIQISALRCNIYQLLSQACKHCRESIRMTNKARWFNNHLCKMKKYLEGLNYTILAFSDNPERTQQP